MSLPKHNITVIPAAAPVCDFCLNVPVIRCYNADSFVLDSAHPEVGLTRPLYSAGGWTACVECAALVDAGEWITLIDRAVDAFIRRHPEANDPHAREFIRAKVSDSYETLRRAMHGNVRAKA
jgi:hypothetical protein